MNDEVFITTKRAARNMSFQEIAPGNGVVNVLAEVLGSELIALPVQAPLSVYVY